MKRMLALLLLLTGTLTAQNKGQDVPADVELLRDVDYGTGGGRTLKMNILRPKTPPKGLLPVVVYIYGGGWRAGSRAAGIGPLSALAQKGYFGASI